MHVSRMFSPERTPDDRVETQFDKDGAGTLMTMRMTMADEKTRASALATGMAVGMEAIFARLEGIIPFAATA